MVGPLLIMEDIKPYFGPMPKGGAFHMYSTAGAANKQRMPMMIKHTPPNLFAATNLFFRLNIITSPFFRFVAFLKTPDLASDSST